MAEESVKRHKGTRHEKEYKQILRYGILPDEGIEVINRILLVPHPQVVVSTRELTTRLREVRTSHEEFPPSITNSIAEPQEPVYQRPELSTGYSPPGSDMEIILAKVWQKHLGMEKVGLHTRHIYGCSYWKKPSAFEQHRTKNGGNIESLQKRF